MRTSIAALALIRRVEHGETLWLAQWNNNWQAYAFIGGHKRPEESFRECVIREIQEELDLRYETDFTVSHTPAAQLQYTAWSQGAQQETAYTMELFDVRLDEQVRMKVEGNSDNRWLTHAEIQTRRTADGRAVSETVVKLLQAIEQSP